MGPQKGFSSPSVSQASAIPWKAQQSADGGLHLPRVVWSPSIWLETRTLALQILMVNPYLAIATACAFGSNLFSYRSENIRAYISRSFTNPMWHDILGNKHMQKAIVMAQICLYVVPCMQSVCFLWFRRIYPGRDESVHGTLDLGNCTADF